MIDNEFKFRTSISREGYENKETAKACLSSVTAKQIGREKIAFKEQEVTVDEFLGYAVKGYAFCNLFEFDDTRKYWIKSGKKHHREVYPVYRKGLNKGYFRIDFKSDIFFKGSQTIFVDIDYTHFQEVTDYINCLHYKPTCAYTSYSDRVNKNGKVSRRFRLVYVFDSILTSEEFKNTSSTLYESIVKDTNEPMDDNCGCSYSQYMNGSNSMECYSTGIIYSLTDFPKHTEEVKEDEEEFNDECIDIDALEDELDKASLFSEELLDDMKYAPYDLVVRKWWAKGLRYITQTEVEFNGFYTTTTEDFLRLAYIHDKIKDGNQRRKKLFIRAALRRLIKSDITPDELLYNLYIDRYKFFDNSDGVLTNEVLMNKVKAALDEDKDEIKCLVNKSYKPSFIINPSVEDKRRAIGYARKDITDTKIGEIYDVNLSVKENYQLIKGYGISVSLSRLYKWCDTNNIDKAKKAIKTGYNPQLSIRENMKAMNCTMYQVQKAKKDYENKGGLVG